MSSTDGSTASLQLLLERAAAGDNGAYAQFLTLASDRLMRLTRKMFRRFPHLRRWEQTDDVYQQVAMQLHRSLSQVKPTNVRAFTGLAALQIRRTLIDLARHYFGPEGEAAKHHTSTFDSTDAPLEVVGRTASRQTDSCEPETMEAWAAFHLAVESLPPEESDAFGLIWYLGVTQREAAEMLGVASRTVERRLLRARAHLGEILCNQFPIREKS